MSESYFKERDMCQKLLEVCADSMPKIKPMSYIEDLVNDPPTIAVSDSSVKDARDNSDEGEQQVGVPAAYSYPVNVPVQSGRGSYGQAGSSCWDGLYGQK